MSVGIAPEVVGLAIVVWALLPSVRERMRRHEVRKAFERRQAMRRLKYLSHLIGDDHDQTH